MDPVASLTPTLRIDRLQSSLGNKQQQTFSRGQVLQGQITGKSNQQFILEVGGERFLADSKAPLQTGQRLDLLVTATTPRISLQILADPLAQRIGKNLHMLPEGGSLLTQTANLVTGLPQDTLSPRSQQALALVLNSPTAKLPAIQSPSQLGKHLASLLTQVLTATDTREQNKAFTSLGSLLKAIAQTQPAEDPQGSLAQILQQHISNQNTRTPIEQLLSKESMAGVTAQVNAQLQSITGQPTSGNTEQLLVNILQQIMGNRETATPTPFLKDLLTLIDNQLRSPDPLWQKTIPTGKDLEQTINRLGINLEHLLATGKQEEAALTLKSALLELAHNLPAEKGQAQAEQLAGTIQLYQMLQIRLASEAIFFLPLPLPFLHHGFLLVEPDSKSQSDKEQAAEKKTYALHLNLEGLGNLQINMNQVAGGIRLRFFAEDSGKAKFLAENREELQQWLTATPLESVQFLTGAEDPIRKLLPSTGSGHANVLDTNA